MPPEGTAAAEGFGAYPLDGDSWWQELPAMKERAERYGVQAEIREAAEKLKIAGTDLKEQGAFKKANKPVREYKTVSRELKEELQSASDQIFRSAPAEQKEAVMEYTDQFFSDTNNMLYAKDDYYQRAENKELLGKIKTRVRHLDKIIKEYTLTDDIVAWRGTEAEYYTGWEAGQTYELPGYVSTCVDKGNEIVNPDFIIEMWIKKGTRGTYLGNNSAHPTEDEFLLGRWRKYTVIEKTKSSMILEASNN
ncbi:ADP-ribosyltransferase [Treponema endosymbiont of Eucomonympha sp.]|uniref:ADP-ribosyltransferase n=1 Tax=Treponema endosymbiont of Eucomonympha sp. TaxID=1580831 RepID=UPI0007812A5B|nr:ADP-ribosyltransferase [Treponema endosymbiont of Eucomonympha sp.]